MYEAFTQSQSDTVDIFGLAESLASGAPPPSNLLQEFVQKSDFIRELEDLMDSAQAADQELAEKRALLVQQRTETEINSETYMSDTVF